MKNEGMAIAQEPPTRARLCMELLKPIMFCPGDVIEMGVCEGATTVHLAGLLKQYNVPKRYFACDTFCGLPEAEGELQKGECESSLEEFCDNIAEVMAHVIPIAGRLEDTLSDERFGKLGRHYLFNFAFLDLDLESATRYGITWLLPRLYPGAIIGFHDYGFERTPGIKRAVDELIPRDQFEEIPLGNTGDNIIFFRRVKYL